jgi:hypothetical protein
MSFSLDDCGWVVKTALPSSLVYYLIKFFHNDTTYVVLNKLSNIELFRVDKNSKELLPELSVAVLGPVEHLHYLGDCKILIINRKAQFSILKFLENEDMKDKMHTEKSTEAYFEKVKVLVRGNLEDEAIRPIARGSILSVDPLFRFFVYLGSQGILRMVPIYSRGKDLFLGQIHNLRMFEMNILDVKLSFHSNLSDVVVLTVLFQEGVSLFKIRYYHIDWSSPTVFSDRHMTPQDAFEIPFQLPQKLLVNSFTNEIILFAIDAICVYPRRASIKTVFTEYSGMCLAGPETIICTDFTGKLYNISMNGDGIQITVLGKLPPVTNMIYFEEGTVFCGGAQGFDNLVITLSRECNSKGDYIANIIPIGSCSEINNIMDGFERGGVVTAISSSQEPFPSFGKIALIRDGYACKLNNAIELDTGGAQMSKIFHVTINFNQYLVVGDPFGTRVVLDLERGYQPAQQVESGTLELIKGARGLRITSRGVLYSFSEKSIFIISPKMELVYKAKNGNLIKNFDVYEDICVIHSSQDAVIGPVGWGWRHTIPMTELGEIASFTISRCHGNLILAIINWSNTLKIYSITEANLNQILEMKIEKIVAPRDISLLCGESSGEIFILIGDCKGIIHVYNILTGQLSEINSGFRGPIKFESFLDRIVLMGEKPGILSYLHGTIILTPLNLPLINAFVETGMGGFSAITCGNVLICGSIDIENLSGKQLTKVRQQIL